MQKGIIFSIEEFAIHDGPGIRTTVFLKGCPLRCAWCHNPEGFSPQPQPMIRRGVSEVCGREVTTGDLAAQLLRDREIYRINGGGVTLTGGEPLMQPDFAEELLAMLRPEVHTAIETSGYASAETFRRVVAQCELVMLDIKHTDPAIHRRFTGVDNAPILRNLEYLAASDKPFIVRIPLIPGVNDTERNMKEVLALIRDARSLERVEILRYHKTAGAKYPMVGRKYDPPFDAGQEPHVCDLFTENQITTVIL